MGAALGLYPLLARVPAFDRAVSTAAELLEKASQVYVMAASLDQVNPLPPDIVEVEQYLTKPLPYERLVVRSLWAVIQNNVRHGVKESRLVPGEHMLLFLEKRPFWDLQETQFGLLCPLGGKFWIEGNEVINVMWGAPPVSLAKIRRRIPK